MTNHSTVILLLAPVALAVDLPAEGLTRGQMGTVVEFLATGTERALLVEFADQDGESYALKPLEPEQLIVLHRRSQSA
jgi:hypothetical protein